MFKVEKVTDDKGRVLIQDPPIARFFFQSTVAAWCGSSCGSMSATTS